MVETPQETQRKMRTWVASGYEIEIIAQSPVYQGEGLQVITSAWLKKYTDNRPMTKYKPVKIDITDNDSPF